jgi:hypothetical protein
MTRPGNQTIDPVQVAGCAGWPGARRKLWVEGCLRVKTILPTGRRFGKVEDPAEPLAHIEVRVTGRRPDVQTLLTTKLFPKVVMQEPPAPVDIPEQQRHAYDRLERD